MFDVKCIICGTECSYNSLGWCDRCLPYSFKEETNVSYSTEGAKHCGNLSEMNDAINGDSECDKDKYNCSVCGLSSVAGDEGIDIAIKQLEVAKKINAKGNYDTEQMEAVLESIKWSLYSVGR